MTLDPLRVTRVAQFTHEATTSYRVGNYIFFEAAPKPLPTLKRVYFVSYRGEWVSLNSFDTLEEAMRAAADFADAQKR